MLAWTDGMGVRAPVSLYSARRREVGGRWGPETAAELNTTRSASATRFRARLRLLPAGAGRHAAIPAARGGGAGQRLTRSSSLTLCVDSTSSVASQIARPRPIAFATVLNSVEQC
jgi:hypothetical protein